MTGRPAALSAFALASTARVADSVMALTRSERRRWGAVIRPSCHHRDGARSPSPPAGLTADGFDGSAPGNYTSHIGGGSAADPARPDGLTGAVRGALPSVVRPGTSRPRPSQGSSSIG